MLAPEIKLRRSHLRTAQAQRGEIVIYAADACQTVAGSLAVHRENGGNVIGIILAGGLASRMGGEEKAFLRVGRLTIIERVLAILRPQCEGVVINANGDPARFAGFGCPVVPDSVPDRPGPLAGLLAGLDHVAALWPSATAILTVPSDAPFLPLDLVARLQDRRIADRAEIVRACSGNNDHSVVALWSLALREDLRRALVVDGLRKVGAFAARHPLASVTWPTQPIDPFFNVNTPGDLAAAERAVVGLESDP